MEKEKRIISSPNPNTLRCVLEILDTECQVDFNADDSLYKVPSMKVRILSTY